MTVVNLPHVDTAPKNLKVTPTEKGYQVSCHSEKMGAIVCELDKHKNVMASDIHDLICQCMRAGYRQCQSDMRKLIGVDC